MPYYQGEDSLGYRISITLPWMVLLIVFVLVAIVVLVWLAPGGDNTALIAAILGLPTMLVGGMLAILKLNLNVLEAKIQKTQDVLIDTKHEINSRMDELKKLSYERGVSDQKEIIAALAQRKLEKEEGEKESPASGEHVVTSDTPVKIAKK